MVDRISVLWWCKRQGCTLYMEGIRDVVTVRYVYFGIEGLRGSSRSILPGALVGFGGYLGWRVPGGGGGDGNI